MANKSSISVKVQMATQPVRNVVSDLITSEATGDKDLKGLQGELRRLMRETREFRKRNTELLTARDVAKAEAKAAAIAARGKKTA